MNVIIVEDETAAAQKIAGLLRSADPSVSIKSILGSVKETVNWLNNNPAPDLGFFDIRLADDHSFRIFEETEINFPVVFVTAYDDYLLKAFAYHSIHYLLKPVNEKQIGQAIDKFRKLEKHFIRIDPAKLPTAFNPAFKTQLVARKGSEFIPIAADHIAYIFSEHKIAFIKTVSGIIYMSDETLTAIEKTLDPDHFFRANRQYIVKRNNISGYRSIAQSKIRITLEPPTPAEVIIGKEQAVLFRKWIRQQVS